MTGDPIPDDERPVEYLDDDRPEDRSDSREGRDFDWDAPPSIAR